MRPRVKTQSLPGKIFSVDATRNSSASMAISSIELSSSTQAHLHGKIPSLHAPDEEFLAHLKSLSSKLQRPTIHFTSAKPPVIMELAHAGNVYLMLKNLEGDA